MSRGAPLAGHGLPGPLPAGERVLWRGAPDWRALARDALHLRGLALYAGALVASVAIAAAWRGAGANEFVVGTLLAAAIAAIPLLLGIAYAWGSARATTYTITNRRVVLHMGIALPMTVNLPFSRIESAAMRAGSFGTGEIRLKLVANGGLSWVMLWPHARVGRTAPTLRALPDADRAGQVLARALAATLDTPVPLAQAARVVETAPENRGANAVAA